VAAVAAIRTQAVSERSGSMDTNNEQPEAPTYGHDVVVRVRGAALPLTLGVEHAARLVGVARSSMYAAVKRGDVPAARINGRTVVLTVPLLEQMGVPIETAGQAPTDP
jgi:hypothetical protein